jgi:hypothetical protein
MRDGVALANSEWYLESFFDAGSRAALAADRAGFFHGRATD